MMYPPNQPKPSLAYVAAQRTANQAPQQDSLEDARSKAPFWMLQSVLGSSVPDENCEVELDMATWLNAKKPKGTYLYNNVDFVPVLKQVDQANGGNPPPPALVGAPVFGKYITMGSVFATANNASAANALEDRFFLVKVEDGSSYCIGGVTFAPAGSYIFSFSATEPGAGAFGEGVEQDGICGCIGEDGWAAEELKPLGCDGPKYCVYTNQLKVHAKMFNGIPDPDDPPVDTVVSNPLKGLKKVLEECHFKDGGKEITIVGWSLGGAQAQIAAVRIAVEYKAKVRLITFDSIMAFTPDSAATIAGTLIADDKVLRYDDFPEPGKINAQRWVENDSPASIAPFNCAMIGCCPFSPHKIKYAGCYPFMSRVGHGHFSKALILSGYHAGFLPCGGGTPTWNLGCIPKNLCFLCDSNPTYPDKSFYSKPPVSDNRMYVTKAANLSRCFVCGYCFCVPQAAKIHGSGAFLLWMLYKGAYQNQDATEGISIYQPKVVIPPVPEMDRS